MQAWAKWVPAPSVKILQFVTRVDGQDGFSVAECDNMADMALDLAKLTPYFEYTVCPVIDVNEDAVALMSEAAAFHKSIQ